MKLSLGKANHAVIQLETEAARVICIISTARMRISGGRLLAHN